MLPFFLTKHFMSLQLFPKLFFHIYYKNFFILLFLSVSLWGQNQNDEFIKFINEYRINKDVPSIAAGISQNGKILWMGSSGFINLENYVSANVNSVYRIASISKSITAVAIMQLVERGKIKLDTDIRSYLSYYPKKRWTITVRHLLNHTSGIRTYKGPDEIHSKTNFPTIKSSVLYFAYDSLQYEPGTKYLYSTLTYNVLAAIIETVSGQSFGEYLKQNIFNIAGMSNSYLDYYNILIPNRADGYQRNEYRKIENAPLADLTIKFPGGGILSSVEDLLKFAIALQSDRLIKQSTLDSMLVPTQLKNGETRNYGLGFTLGIDENGRNYFGHQGGGTGFTSNLIIFSNEKLAAVYLINIRDRFLEDPAMTLTRSMIIKDKIPSPKSSISDRLFSIITNAGIDSALLFYDKSKIDSLSVYQISKEELRLLGYDLSNIRMFKEAITIFNLIIETNPEYADAYIGLGDVFFKDNNMGLALRNYRRGLKFAPKDEYILKMIKKIEQKK